MDGILLLAGNSTRFGENKLCYLVDGKPMYRYIWDVYQGCQQKKLLDQVVVVTQYEQILQDLSSENCILVENYATEKGLSHSVSLGISALLQAQPFSQNCMFSVGDQPYFTQGSAEKFILNFKEQPTGISRCVSQGRGGNPSIFQRKYYDELMALRGDTGGKQVMKRHPQDVFDFQVASEELEDFDVKPVPF